MVMSVTLLQYDLADMPSRLIHSGRVVLHDEA